MGMVRMGDSQHRAGPTVGKVIYVWKEGTEYGNMLRGWIGPISMATAVSKYMGLSTDASVTVGLALVVGITAFTFLAGAWHIRVGGARAVASNNNANDPWRTYVESVMRKLETQLDAR